MAQSMPDCFDYVIAGSGLGGSVSAMRLTEKGYRVRVLEQGKRFRDQDLAKSTWRVRKNLVSKPDVEHTIPTKIDIGHKVTRLFAQKTGAIPAGSINEGLLNIPMTAHILGGVPFGLDDQDGVVKLNCEIHNYPGLFVVDGSIAPANPGVNLGLTIAAPAKYALSRVPDKPGARVRQPIGLVE